MSEARSLRIAVEGCGHGALDPIYASIEKACEVRGWDGVDLVIIGGDFQAVRTQEDLNVTAMPAKYRKMGDFHRYYDGTKTAPYLTIFIGGNHEASNHLFELYYGGWVAPNIYYMGAANVLQFGPIKIAGMSGIWKGSDYRKPHFERLPYNDGTMRSIYHVRELDVRKLLAYRSQVDIALSHDWPQGIEWLGDHKALFRAKPYLQEDARSGRLNSVAAREVMERLRPAHWFSAHHHYKFTAVKTFTDPIPDDQQQPSNNISLSHDYPTPLQDNSVSNQNHGAISAWNNFHSDAGRREAQEAEVELRRARNRQDQADQTGQQIAPSYTFEETFKQVQLDGINREIAKNRGLLQEKPAIPQVDGSGFSLPLKRHRDSSAHENPEAPPNSHDVASVAISQYDGAVSSLLKIVDPDAIDIDMSDEEAEDDRNKEQINSKHNDSNDRISQEPTSQAGIAPEAVQPTQFTEPPKEDNGVSSDVRAKLAAMSDTFVAQPRVQTTPKLPHPDTIWNQETRFLALSKCEAGKDFLQLLEINPLNGASPTTERPLRLQYDPEWLAILRVFASELTLGGSNNDRGPQNRGDTFYRDQILKEEQWVRENVIEKSLLVIPTNFETTTTSQPQSDSSTMPREVTNPQTSQFCKLIGIENKFDISEEERDQRMAAGAPQQSGYHGRRGGRGGFDGRGRGRGRGRGGGRGRSQGRW